MSEYDKIYNDLNYLNISNESFSSTVKEMLRRLIEAVKNFIKENTANTYAKQTLYSLKTDLNALENATRTGKMEFGDGSIELSRNVRYLTINYIGLKDLKTLTRHVNNVQTILDDFIAFKDIVENQNIDNLDTLGERLKRVNPFDYFKKLNNFRESGNKIESIPLMGSIIIQFDNHSNVEYLDKIPNFSPKFIESTRESKQFPSELTFEKFSISMQASFLRNVYKLFDTLNDHFSGNNINKRISKLKEIERLLNKLNSDTTTEESVLRKQILELTVYMKWLDVMEQDLFNYIKNIIQTCMYLMQENLTFVNKT